MADRNSMKSSRLKTVQPNWRCRLISLFVQIGLCASLFPLPIGWYNASEKDLSAPFPCQNRPCGCKSAEQCWKRCCCFNNKQKLAWARANQVAAPSYVALEAEKEEIESDHLSSACCSRCVKSKQTAARKPCCQAAGASHGKSSLCAHEAEQDLTATKEDRSSTRLVLGMYWHNCQGQNWFWNSLPWCILNDDQELIAAPSKNAKSIGPLARQHPQFSLQPPVPPPRHLLRS